MKKIIPPASLIQLVDSEIKELNDIAKKRLAETAAIEKKRAEKAKFNLNFGLGMAQFIWNWAQELRQSDFGKKMTKINDIYFYHGPVAAPHKDIHLMINKKGLHRVYQSRFTHHDFYKSAKDLAIDVPPTILTEAVNLIKTGDVWITIQEQLLNRLRLEHGVII